MKVEVCGSGQDFGVKKYGSGIKFVLFTHKTVIKICSPQFFVSS